jgi:hypothetical protein
MSWSDPIVEEVRKAREAYAARFNYDLHAIFRDLQVQEQRSGRPVIASNQTVIPIPTTPDTLNTTPVEQRR